MIEVSFVGTSSVSWGRAAATASTREAGEQQPRSGTWRSQRDRRGMAWRSKARLE